MDISTNPFEVSSLYQRILAINPDLADDIVDSDVAKMQMILANLEKKDTFKPIKLVDKKGVKVPTLADIFKYKYVQIQHTSPISYLTLSSPSMGSTIEVEISTDVFKFISTLLNMSGRIPTEIEGLASLKIDIIKNINNISTTLKLKNFLLSSNVYPELTNTLVEELFI